jgi:very-short-patch-repair endonuclease
VRNELTRLLAMRGAARRRDLDHPWLLDHAAAAGKVVQLFPGVYVEASRRREDLVRRQAALSYLDGRGALSHTTALAIWRIGWEEPNHARLHATVPPKVQLRGGKGLVLHRHASFGETHRRGGLIVVPLAEAIVRSWPLLPASHRTGVVIAAITDRHVTIDRLRWRLADNPRLTGAAELKRLLGLIAAGCRSPLELWGAIHVFTGPGMPPFKRQYQVASFLLDVYAEQEQVAFELDGDAFHASRVQRERDLRRDAVLATYGIQVVRFTYARLMSEPEAVRREVLAILAAARRRAGGP